MEQASAGLRYRLVRGVSQWLLLPVRAVFRKGDGCPEGVAAAAVLPAPNCSSLQYALLFTTGVTCLALLLDLTKRYILTPARAERGTNTEGAGGKDVVVKERTLVVESGHVTQRETMAAAPPPYRMKSTEQSLDATDLDLPEQSPQAGRSPEGNDNGQSDQAVSGMMDDLLTALRTSVCSLSGQDIPESCKETLSKLAGVESVINHASREIDSAAVSMVAMPTSTVTDDTDLLARLEKEGAVYRKYWLGLRRLLYCLDIQLKNSTAYQLFHHDCDSLQANIDTYLATLQTSEGNEPSSLQEMCASVGELEAIHTNLLLWGNAVARLSEQSKNVHPLHLRTEESSQQLVVRALCNYKCGEVAVAEGEVMLLLSNSDPEKWKLLKSSGEEVEVPSVCCVIPPPDVNTMKQAARTESSYKALSDFVLEMCDKRIKAFAECLQKIVSSKEFDSIDKESRDNLLTQMAFLEVFLRKYFPGEHTDVLECINTLRTSLSNTKEGVNDDVMSELLELFSNWQKVATVYETAVYEKERRKVLVKQGVILDTDETEWDTLAELEEAQRQLSVAVSVQRETMAIGETTKYETATGETRQTFSITAVLDPRDNSKLSMSEAIQKGLLNQRLGMYRNPQTGEEMPIGVAMNSGLIIVEATKTTKARELKKSVGVVTVEYRRETRPYRITHVIHPTSQEQITIGEAVEQGVFDSERQVYVNTKSGEVVSVENAIDSGVLVVEYDAEAEVTEKPQVTSKTFAISSVRDKKQGKSYPFDEAVDRGLLDRERGVFVDTETGLECNLVEAMKKHYVKGKVVTDHRKIDAFMSRNRSSSMDSVDSVTDTE